jgi:dGTPase
LKDSHNRLKVFEIMITREDQEKREYVILSEFACKSADSKGRAFDEQKCNIRTDFQRDRDRIVHSKAFRRLMHKTQVFLSQEGDHFRTRLTHTIEVSQISRTICRALGLNEDLAEAIALGHDLGHTPFGHLGEQVLNALHPGGFRHNVQSLRVVDVLEGDRTKGGLNLTAEVRDGILNHTGHTKPFTLEGQVVKISDRIAYINHDIDDALRIGVLKQSDLPASCLEVLGNDHRTRIDTMVQDMITSSDGKDHIEQSPEIKKQMDILRNFMFKHVYESLDVKREEETEMGEKVITILYHHFMNHPSWLPRDIQEMIVEYGIAEVSKDYVASMTDRYAITCYKKIIE